MVRRVVKEAPTRSKTMRGGDSDVMRPTPALYGPIAVLIRHWKLIAVLVRQDILNMYARTWLGLFWIVLLPVFYITVFILIRLLLFDRSNPVWTGSELGIEPVQMAAIMIICGLIVFWEASEILSRAAGAVRSNKVYVRDTVFPVEVLPWVTVGNAVFNMVVRFVLFMVAYLVVVHSIPAEALLFPLIIAPLILLMVGIAYLFSAIGVYVRDLDLVVSVMMVGLLLMSAVIYPIQSVPESYRPYVYLNPIAGTIEAAREAVVLGQQPNWLYLGGVLLVALVFAWVGFAVFQRLRRRFADVL